MNITPEIREKLAKVYELVKRGATEGEQRAAQGRLDALLKKFNIEGIDIDSIDRIERRFKYSDALDHQLFIRILRFMIDDAGALQRAKRDTRHKKEFVIDLNYMDYVKVEASYEYFRRHMHQQWRSYSGTELKKCRKAKTKNKKRSLLQDLFMVKYFVASGLCKPDELVEVTDMSKEEMQYREMLNRVEGGSYNTQMNTGLLLN